jgi:endonuclease-3 related protein
MIHTIHERFDGSLEQLFSLETLALRKELLSWRGIGPETADCIILYAAQRPVFVIDAYSRRICDRHGWLPGKSSYNKVAKLFTGNLPEDVQLFNEYHALIVQVCKDYCRAQIPKCETCPLKDFLPADHTDQHR